MKQVTLLGILIQFGTNLKQVKKDLSPIVWDKFRAAVNSNNIPAVKHILTYPDFYNRYYIWLVVLSKSILRGVFIFHR